jgi:hypothetical protein
LFLGDCGDECGVDFLCFLYDLKCVNELGFDFREFLGYRYFFGGVRVWFRLCRN